MMNARYVAPVSVTLADLRRAVFSLYPMLRQYTWVDDTLSELYENGAPDPNPLNEGKRIIIPSQWLDFSHRVAQRIGIELYATAKQ